MSAPKLHVCDGLFQLLQSQIRLGFACHEFFPLNKREHKLFPCPVCRDEDAKIRATPGFQTPEIFAATLLYKKRENFIGRLLAPAR